MVTSNCDGLSQFYFGGFLAFVRKFGNDDTTIFILRARDYVKRRIENFDQFSRVADVHDGVNEPSNDNQEA